MILNGDNSTLKAKIAALAQDKIFKDGKFYKQTQRLDLIKGLRNEYLELLLKRFDGCRWQLIKKR